MTGIEVVIRALTEARDAALDLDEDLARAQDGRRLIGVTFPASSLDGLIFVLQDEQQRLDLVVGLQQRLRADLRRQRWLTGASVVASVVALGLALSRLFS